MGGSGCEHNRACGIRIMTSAERQYRNIQIDCLEVSGSGEDGVFIHSTAGNSGLKNIRITNVRATVTVAPAFDRNRRLSGHAARALRRLLEPRDTGIQNPYRVRHCNRRLPPRHD